MGRISGKNMLKTVIRVIIAVLIILAMWFWLVIFVLASKL